MGKTGIYLLTVSVFLPGWLKKRWFFVTRFVRGCSWQLFNQYSFKLFRRFWLAFSLISRLILHNQLALTKFGRCLPTLTEVTQILPIDRKRDRRRRGRSAALAVQSRRKQRRVWQGIAGAARKVSSNWSQETLTCHSSNCFSIVWGQGNALLVTSLPSSCYMTLNPWLVLRRRKIRTTA